MKKYQLVLSIALMFILLPAISNAQFGRFGGYKPSIKNIVRDQLERNVQPQVKRGAIKSVRTMLAGGTQNIQIEKMPKTIEEFKALKAFDLTNPKNTAALFIVAMCVYPDNPELASEMIEILNGPREYRGDRLIERLRTIPYLGYSYFRGATPDNNYTPSQPYTISVSSLPRQEGYDNHYCRVEVRSGGADSPRQIVLRSKGGEWFIWFYANVVTKVRDPKANDPWAD